MKLSSKSRATLNSFTKFIVILVGGGSAIIIATAGFLAVIFVLSELIQDKATVESLSAEVVNIFTANSAELIEQFDQLHQQLCPDSAAVAKN